LPFNRDGFYVVDEPAPQLRRRVVPRVGANIARNVVPKPKPIKVSPKCPLCEEYHDPNEDPIKKLKGTELIYGPDGRQRGVVPHIFVFFGKEIIPVRRTDIGPKSYPPPPAPEPYLGLEVEVDLPDRYADRTACQGALADIWQSHGLGYTQLDGTVTGVESVTFPHTFARLRDSEFEAALVDFKKAGAAAWKCAGPGLHIHINRSGFKDREHQWRFVAVHEANAETLKKLSGRVSNYNPWPDGNYVPRPTQVLDGVVNQHRANAINLTNLKTIELRFWQGTLQPVGALGAAAVESCIFEYTKDLDASHDVTDKLYKWKSMLEWTKTDLPDEHARVLALTALRSGESEE
jgi:hypothetical protein